MTYKALYPLLTLRSFTTKSIEISSYFYSRIVRGYSNLTVTMLNFNLSTNHALWYKIFYCLFHVRIPKKLSQILIHLYTLKVDSVKCIKYFHQNLSPQLVILRNTDSVSKSQNSIQYPNIWLQYIINSLDHLCIPLINGLSNPDLIK